MTRDKDLSALLKEALTSSLQAVLSQTLCSSITDTIIN
jgi:hypothetical protein